MFKHLRHLAKATLASIILVTPFAAQAAVEMNSSSFTGHLPPLSKNMDQDVTKIRLTTDIPTEIIFNLRTLSETGDRTSNFSSPDKTPNDTSSINKITTAL